MTFTAAVLFFAGTFCQVFLLGFQSRSVNSGKYVMAAGTATMIGAAQLIVIRTIAVQNPYWVLVLTCIAGPAGICSAMFVHQKMFPKKPS